VAEFLSVVYNEELQKKLKQEQKQKNKVSVSTSSNSTKKPIARRRKK
jgi:hypothetical protein